MRSPIALALILALAPTVAAKTLKVPKDHATIQAAVLAADDGDTVLVKPGEYREIVVVPFSSPGITIKGTKKGAVIIDARVVAGGSGAGVRVFADGVTLKNLVVRHALDQAGAFPFNDGHGLYVSGDDVRLDDVQVLHSGDAGIFIDAARPLVRRCLVRRALHGIVIQGDDARIVDTAIEMSEDEGVLISGDDAIVDRSAIRTSMFANGIAITGDRATVRATLVEQTDEVGILVIGDDAQIEENTVRGSYSDAGSIHVAGGDRAIIRKNVCRDSLAPGIFDESSDGRVAGNLVRDCGAGIRVVADDVDILDNTVIDTGYDAFSIDGHDNFVSGNVARGNLYDGFEVVGGNNNLLIDNESFDNHAEGIENDGNFTEIIGNTAKRNRLDVANGGGISTFQNNSFVTGGPFTPPILDDD